MFFFKQGEKEGLTIICGKGPILIYTLLQLVTTCIGTHLVGPTIPPDQSTANGRRPNLLHEDHATPRHRGRRCKGQVLPNAVRIG